MGRRSQITVKIPPRIVMKTLIDILVEMVFDAVKGVDTSEAKKRLVLKRVGEKLIELSKMEEP